ncbi:MAG: glycosyltransferase [Flavobacteriales bacterium Tduv]
MKEDTVKLLGFKKKYFYLKEADIFMMSSHHEGFPYIILEAPNTGQTCYINKYHRNKKSIKRRRTGPIPKQFKKKPLSRLQKNDNE